MSCPVEIQSIIAEIVRLGILRIRAAAWAGDAEECAIEADHIHNLPSLLRDFQPELLRSYWNVQRQVFVEASDGRSLGEFLPLWDELGKHSELAESVKAAD